MKASIELTAEQMEEVTKITLMKSFEIALEQDNQDDILRHLRECIKYFTTQAEFEAWTLS